MTFFAGIWVGLIVGMGSVAGILYRYELYNLSEEARHKAHLEAMRASMLSQVQRVPKSPTSPPHTEDV